LGAVVATDEIPAGDGNGVPAKAAILENPQTNGDSASSKTPKSKVRRAKKGKSTRKSMAATPYPKHPLNKVLRISQAILDQNAGKDCSEEEAAQFVGVGYAGPFQVELSSASRYGLITRKSGRVSLEELSRRIVRPQKPEEKVAGLREAVLKAPVITQVYQHYRGENLPDEPFFSNALEDTFHVPKDEIARFKSIFMDNLRLAGLIEEHQDKLRVLDVTKGTPGPTPSPASDRLETLGRGVVVSAEDSCFVMMPFANPIGKYYALIYEPAIKKAGLNPVRADADIFGTGKIMNQVWTGLNSAKVLVAELTGRNPNVFYELGLAHALKKPVVLVSKSEEDVPFDLHHIRVIYYDVTDPFWGEKLIAKVAENILFALKNPKESLFEPSTDPRHAN
jgi:hypothetical protein